MGKEEEGRTEEVGYARTEKEEREGVKERD